MRILLSNDDGIHAPGLHELFSELKKMGEVWVIAPVDEKSTSGHSLTLHKPLRINKMSSLGKRFYSVSGSPADCVYVGIREIMKRKRPDVVVSGINRGANLAQDVYYSGTVSAAREAAIVGVPAVAVSLVINFKSRKPEEKRNYKTASRLTKELIKKIDLKSFPKNRFLNLNVPDIPRRQVKGFRLARIGLRYYAGKVLKRRDHRGREYYWVGGEYSGYQRERSTDCLAVDKKYASVTPISLDCTDYEWMSSFGRSSFFKSD